MVTTQAPRWGCTQVVGSILLLAMLLAGCRNIFGAFASLSYPARCQRDLIQDYLAVKAVTNHQSPYLSIPKLAETFLPECEHYTHLRHPTPHAPGAILLSLPLAAVSYPVAAAFWILLELGLLGASIAMLLVEVSGKAPLRKVLPLLLITCAIPSVAVELLLGQWGAISMFLTTLFVRSFLRERERLAAVSLALLANIKFFGAPIWIYLLLKGRFRLVALACLASGVLLLLTLGTMPGRELTKYYTIVAPQVAGEYADQGRNQSLWVLSKRIFAGFPSTKSHFQGQGVPAVPPIIAAPELTQPLALAFGLAPVLLALLIACRARSTETALIAVVSVSVISTPIAWSNGLLVCASLIPSLLRPALPRMDRLLLAAIACLVVLPVPLNHTLTTPLLPLWSATGDIGVFLLLLFAWRRESTERIGLAS